MNTNNGGELKVKQTNPSGNQIVNKITNNITNHLIN